MAKLSCLAQLEQTSEAGAPFEIEQEARRQSREHGRSGHARSIEQVRDPVIADVEQMKLAVGAEEQARAIEAGPEGRRQNTIGLAGKARVELVGEPVEA